MKKLIIAAVAALSLVAVAFKPGTKNATSYKVSAEQSTFNWVAKKVVGDPHKGLIKFATGSIETDGKNLTGGNFDIDMTTITCTDLTGELNEKLIGHLNSPDFFSVDNFKTANLKIKSANEIKGAKTAANNYNIVADLTIKGITKEISFPAFVVIKKTGEVVANASFDIDRTAYDIKYGSKNFFEGLGNNVIDDKFNVKVRIVATK